VRDHGFVGALINGHVDPSASHGPAAGMQPGVADPRWSLSFNAFQAMANVIGVDRVVFTADYPFANMEAGQGEDRPLKRRTSSSARMTDWICRFAFGERGFGLIVVS
jgi:hypothetical protein